MKNVKRFFQQNIWARVSFLLALPLSWLLIIYIGSLFALFITSIWKIDTFTSKVIREFTLENFFDVFTDRAYFNVTIRTLMVAISVTIICAIIAIPMAFFMARIAKPRSRPILIALVITPLWASYLVKIYAWRTMFYPESGFLNWLISPLGGSSPGFGMLAVIIGLTYLWLPYMVLPIYAGMEKLPNSMLDASSDLGAKPGRTFFRVILPITWPAIVAGSVFTFSLSMGDYITVQILGGTFQMLGNVVYQNFSLNLPFAAAVALIPVIIMMVYLAGIRRTGALENL
ncbi:MAG: ABC transporter permease [Actinobacteria bacterium]|jgi:putative spermidine/putrescine transport system permease protein|nr:ABC transporter permease [Actinomycetota bacterium]NDD60205.1 ABC transporter permease [Actinomycetota bacterium]NDE51164.1 ABC transporter permease [Actinomycetota bacterium]NDF42621.1 ABC transporter permease [Actinomycetota bacterium]